MCTFQRHPSWAAYARRRPSRPFCRGITNGGTHRRRRSRSRRPMKSAAREGAVAGAEPRRRERPERRRRALGVQTPREARRRRARRREQPPSGGVGGPSPQGHPARVRGGAHDGERTDACAHGRLRRPEQRPHRERHADRAGGVEPPRQDLPRHDQHAGPAALALVAPCPNAGQRRRPLRSGRATDLALPRAVTVHGEGRTCGAARGAAAEALRRPHRRDRWHFGLPVLDAHRTSANLVGTPHSARGARREGGSVQDAPFASTILWPTVACAPPPWLLLTTSAPRAVLVALADPDHGAARSRPSPSARAAGPGSINHSARQQQGAHDSSRGG